MLALQHCCGLAASGVQSAPPVGMLSRHNVWPCDTLLLQPTASRAAVQAKRRGADLASLNKRNAEANFKVCGLVAS